MSALALVGAAEVMFIGSHGFESSRNDKLKRMLSEKLSGVAKDKQLCVAHGGLNLDALSQINAGCDAGFAMLGAAPEPELLEKLDGRTLVIGGDLDGSIPFSHFAVARHKASKDRHFAVVRGASHASFAPGQQSEEDQETDLDPLVSEDESFKLVTDIVFDFVNGGGEALASAEHAAAQLADPVIDALKLEGSTELGHPACNSDYPTNPQCNYPRFPNHSLPFGPAPAPSPPLPADCICGSPWIVQSAADSAYDLPGPYKSFTNDAFVDVMDTHPFHLPHVFNNCVKPDASCVLNITSATQPWKEAGDLWPQGKAAPKSILEFRTKFKSREAVRHSANDPTASPNLDKNLDTCKNINKAAFDWALSHAESSVKARFEKSGEPMVMVDDVEQTFGIEGPEWIKDKLVFKRVADAKSPTKTRIEVQSWKFIVGNTNGGHVPWFFPVGMHYCKLLSPARAMEWIYTDSMRSSAQKSTDVVV